MVSLSIDTLKEIISYLTANRIYYKTSIHCPKVDSDGKTVMYKVQFGDDTVWIMHPSLLPGASLLAQKEGLNLMEFDVDAFLRKQCTKLAMQYLDAAIGEFH